jgi:nucleotide-binding universal stress UspA family protein
MTYRSIVVHVASDSGFDARVGLAVELACNMDSHLLGVAPTGLVGMPVALEPAAMGPLHELAVEAMRNEARSAEARFREACEQAGLKSFDSVVDKADPVESLVRHARCSDLCIVGQPDPRHEEHRLKRQQLEQVILHSARPTLIVPYVAGTTTVGRGALVAWDDSREAARAVSDALPLLRLAQRVDVVSWAERGRTTIRPEQLQALQHWLIRQGVAANVHAETTDDGIAETVLSRAADLGSDLIVMGAYGHTRWREVVLGGATRGLLASMTVPVLMSH